MTLDVAALLAEENVFRASVLSQLEWVRAVQAGLPASAVDAVAAKVGFSLPEIERLVIQRRRLAHRRARQRPLSCEESNRLVRIARVGLWAQETFGRRERAIAWLRRSNRVLRGSRPMDLLDTEE